MKLPELPYNSWTETRITLHLFLQIIGKVRLKMMPRKNHWWNITIRLSPKGFTTLSMPTGNERASFEIIYNVHQMQVEIVTGDGRMQAIELNDRLSVGSFYVELMKRLEGLGIRPNIVDQPFDLPITDRFEKITDYHHFNQADILKFWTMMNWTEQVFHEFSGRFYGKTSPAQIFWHHMDMAVTRFSGKKLDPMPAEAQISEKDSYSHEQISFGFWAGDDNVQEPMYYAYAYPSPEGLDAESLGPDFAQWIDSNGSPMAVMPYHQLIQSSDPKSELLNFLESAYQAAASKAGWDVEGLTVPELSDL